MSFGHLQIPFSSSTFPVFGVQIQDSPTFILPLPVGHLVSSIGVVGIASSPPSSLPGPPPKPLEPPPFIGGSKKPSSSQIVSKTK